MAERLGKLSILTVQDLLNERPEALAEALNYSGITGDTVSAWQAQARLVCAVPGLTGTGAQLFVGAGYDDVGTIASADADKLCADLLAFAKGDQGRRILRDGAPPDVARITAWAGAARTAAAA
jgi:hypothetical protein